MATVTKSSIVFSRGATGANGSAGVIDTTGALEYADITIYAATATTLSLNAQNFIIPAAAIVQLRIGPSAAILIATGTGSYSLSIFKNS